MDQRIFNKGLDKKRRHNDDFGVYIWWGDDFDRNLVAKTKLLHVDVLAYGIQLNGKGDGRFFRMLHLFADQPGQRGNVPGSRLLVALMNHAIEASPAVVVKIGS